MSTNFTIGNIKGHVMFLDSLKEKIMEILSFIEKEDIYGDGIWDFSIYKKLWFDNDSEAVLVTIENNDNQYDYTNKTRKPTALAVG